MNRISIFIGIMSVMICLGQSNVVAVDPGPFPGTPELYEMTFTQLTMVKQDGTVVVVNNTPATVDLAAVDANTFIGQVMGGNIVPGVYTQLNSTVSMDITIKGAVMTGVIIYYTTDNVIPVADPADDPDIPDGTGCVPGEYDTTDAMGGAVAYASVQEWYDAGSPTLGGEPAYAQATIHPPTTGATQTQSMGTDPGEPETIVAGQVIEETIEIDVTGAIELVNTGAGWVLFPGEPTINFIDED